MSNLWTPTNPLDLRREQVGRSSVGEDPLQLSQVLPGEPLKVLDQQEGWSLVEALWQPQWADGWRGYVGWVEGELREMEWREPLQAGSVLETARSFLGTPYLWGGMTTEGIDCSGLIHLAYRAAGIIVPRDACDQARAGIPSDSLDPGDLVLMAKRDDPEKISHVMLFEGQGRCIEATTATGTVREIGLLDRIDRSWTPPVLRQAKGFVVSSNASLTPAP